MMIEGSGSGRPKTRGSGGSGSGTLDVNVPSKSNKQKNFEMTEIAGSGSICQRHGSADPDLDPHQNVMDPQHCWE
jgi:hypothetical protein